MSLDDSLLTKVTKLHAGGQGGHNILEDKETIKRGPITEIEVHHGLRIDSIQCKYGGYSGKKLAGAKAGGKKSVFEVPEGYQITEVQVSSGKGQPGFEGTELLSGLRFIATPVSGAGEVIQSEIFGRLGSAPEKFSTASRAPLRYIEANAGIFLDGLTLYFGLRIQVENILIDRDELAKQLTTSKRLIELFILNYKNNTSASQSERKSVVRSRTYSREVSWEAGVSLIAGIEVSTVVGTEIPGLKAETGVSATLSLEISFKYGARETTAVTQTREQEISVNVPANKHVYVIGTNYEAELDQVPVSFEVALYDENGLIQDRTTHRAWISGPALTLETEVNAYELDINAPPAALKEEPGYKETTQPTIPFENEKPKPGQKPNVQPLPKRRGAPT
jgi:hypothetical protein